jgi:uncharacterized protein (DUF433 family)
MVVHELVVIHTSLPTIKRVIETLRDDLGNDWPLQQSELLVPRAATDEELKERKRPRRRGRTIAIERKDDDGLVVQDDVLTARRFLRDVDLIRIRDDLSRGGWAARDSHLSHIEVDPDRLSGRPVIRGKRVPAEFAGELAESTAGRNTLIGGYGLTEAEIDDAQTWWEAARRYQTAA